MGEDILLLFNFIATKAYDLFTILLYLLFPTMNILIIGIMHIIIRLAEQLESK